MFDFLRQLNAADGNGCRLESLEPQHRPDPFLDPAVVPLNQVIQILAGPDAHALRQRANFLEFGHRLVRGGVAVQGDHPWSAVLPGCPGKEPFCGCNIAAFTQEKIHRAALAIHRTVQVDPLATWSRW